MFMHISPVPDMWIFYASIIRHSSTAILSIFNEKATKHAVSEIYGKYSRKFVVHIYPHYPHFYVERFPRKIPYSHLKNLVL